MRNLLFSILMLLGISAFSQTGADSIRIVDLKNQLPTTSGTKKVDLLNEIAWEYGWAALKDKSPTFYYASQARDLAIQLNYQSGIGFALITLSWNNQNANCDSMITAAVRIGEKENNYKLLGRVYHRKWEMKTAYDYYKKAGDVQGEAEAVTWLCTEYAGKGEYDTGFNYCQRAIEFASITKTSTPTYSSFISAVAFETMSQLYSKVGDYKTAFQYLKEMEKYSPEEIVQAFAEFYKEMGKYDSSVYYYEKALQKQPEWGKLLRQVGTANFLAKNYQRAIELLEKELKGENDPNFKWQLPVNWRGSQHLELALSYHALKNIERAKKHYLAALKYQQPEYQKILNETNPNKTAFQKASQLMDISYGLSKSFFGLHKADSAYIYLEKYIYYKDEVKNINTISRLNMQLNNYNKVLENEKKTSQIDLLNKDNQLKEQKIKQGAFVKKGLIVGILLLFLLGIFIVRNFSLKRKNDKIRSQKDLEMQQVESDKKHAELKQQAVELEMQALRAQMNPHFIFNCLSSINRFILKNETEAASDYLTRFSRLIRMVLINSQKSLITLEDEIEMLRLYLDMERMRFKNSFDYHIISTNTVDAGAISIPPLLLQPFCENAIWHGMMNLPAGRQGKEGQGRLDIIFSMDGNTLNCIIADNGIGRQRAAEIKSKSAEEKKSMGLKITTERLALLNQENNFSTFYQIEDILNENNEVAGTCVRLKIRYKESVEEMV